MEFILDWIMDNATTLLILGLGLWFGWKMSGKLKDKKKKEEKPISNDERR